MMRCEGASMTKLPPWLSAGEAIALIAFGKATPAAEWADLPELQETPPWRAPRDLLLVALGARAKGKEWRTPPGEWWTTEEVLAQIARVERETGKDAAALAEELRADIARVGDAEARLTAAETDLRDAAADGRIAAQGRRVTACGERQSHEEIPASAFLRRDREIIAGTDTIRVPDRIEWIDVQFRTADVLAIWPADRRQEAAQTTAAETRMARWLVAQMKAAPNAPIPKPEMRKRAEAAGHVVGDRAFIRAWRIAVKDANAQAWSLPGRKSKRRIEMPD
jgi:hypothetical protein